MLRIVEAINPNGEILSLSLTSSGEIHGLVIVSITGLGPPKTVINTASGPSLDGETYNSSRVEKRNIVLTLAATVGGNGISQVRELVYKFFPINKKIRFNAVTSIRAYETEAIVESCESNMFATVENYVISLICPESYFNQQDDLYVEFSATDWVFEFPFSNESLVDNLIIFGERHPYVNEIVGLPGDKEVGCVLTFHATGPVSDISIYNITHNIEMTIKASEIASIVGSSVIAGDDIIIDTRPRKKSILLVRDGDVYNIFNALGSGVFDKWMLLYPGLNEISYDASSGIDFLELVIILNPLFGGVA